LTDFQKLIQKDFNKTHPVAE